MNRRFQGHQSIEPPDVHKEHMFGYQAREPEVGAGDQAMPPGPPTPAQERVGLAMALDNLAQTVHSTPEAPEVPLCERP